MSIEATLDDDRKHKKRKKLLGDNLHRQTYVRTEVAMQLPLKSKVAEHSHYSFKANRNNDE